MGEDWWILLSFWTCRKRDRRLLTEIFYQGNSMAMKFKYDAAFPWTARTGAMGW